MEIRESLDYLFHFTERYESIVSIMTEKFKPFFCIEDLSFMYDETRNITFAFPIVCFCDIPDERHSLHKKNYGDYGIGLTKEWGINKNLSIVNYSNPQSLKSSGYRVLVNYYLNKHNDSSDDFTQHFGNPFNILLMTSKPYEGYKFDKKKREWTKSSLRFYNEREWRFLPLVDQLNWSLSLEDFSGNYEEFFNAIEQEQPKIQAKYKLDFKVDDIKYIYLKDKQEKNKFISDIEANYTETELRKIESLICFSENEEC